MSIHEPHSPGHASGRLPRSLAVVLTVWLPLEIAILAGCARTSVEDVIACSGRLPKPARILADEIAKTLREFFVHRGWIPA
jgi:hypothetical protein